MSVSKRLTEQLTNYDTAMSVGSKLRSKRIGPLLEMIQQVFTQYGHVSIIDVGGTESYWRIIPDQFLQQCNVHITIVNVSSVTQGSRERFTFASGDGCNLKEFGDRSFHIAHSNSVLEHVGDWNRMVAFASELSRVAERDGSLC